MSNNIASILSFVKQAEKLKTELRHSWLSDKNRQESVAEHSWMMGLMAIILFDEIDIEIDKQKVLKMIIVHDLAEAIIGDIPTFDKTNRKNKFEREKSAIKEITKDLPKKTAQDIYTLWLEVEDAKTQEAVFVQCLDKSEVLIQHIIADIDTWDEGDYSLGPYNKDGLFDFHPFLRDFKNYINEEFWRKMEAEDKLGEIKPEHLARRNSASI